MDFFAHGLWSFIIFNRIKKVWYAVFFGLAPDIFSWTIFFLYNLFAGGQTGRPIQELIPSWMWTLYNVTHSLVVFLIVGAVLLIIFKKKFPLFVLAWPLHIGIDTISHSREFLPTPFLWPLSEWHFPGISWGNSIFLGINYTLIILLLTYILWKRNST